MIWTLKRIEKEQSNGKCEYKRSWPAAARRYWRLASRRYATAWLRRVRRYAAAHASRGVLAASRLLRGAAVRRPFRPGGAYAAYRWSALALVACIYADAHRSLFMRFAGAALGAL